MSDIRQYGISVTESQTFKLFQWRGARRNGCYHRLIPALPISYTQQHEISAKTLPHSVTSWPVSANISRTKSFSKIQQVTTKSMNEGLQTNQLATCDLFPVAMSVLHSSYSIDEATFEHLQICPNPVQDKSFLFSSV